MAWMNSSLFIKDLKMEAISSILVEFLKSSVPSEIDRNDIYIYSDCPQWAVVTGLNSSALDIEVLVKTLLKHTNSVLSLELIGNSLKLRIKHFRKNKNEQHVVSPSGINFDDIYEYQGKMPLYEDVEEKAFQTLKALGVPPILLGLNIESKYTKSKQRKLGGIKINGSNLSQLEPIKIDSSDLEYPPLVVRELASGFGTTIEDDRYIEGLPTKKTIDRLIEIEESLKIRAATILEIEREAIQLNIHYHAGRYQDEVDTLLRAKDRFVPLTTRPPRAPWWAFWRYFGKFS